MDIYFRSKKLYKIFNSEKMIKAEYGTIAARLSQRLSELKAATNLSVISNLPPTRLHQLTLNRKNQYAVDLNGSMRLIFVPANEPLPIGKEGGIDKEAVTEIIIIGVEDYHG